MATALSADTPPAASNARGVDAQTARDTLVRQRDQTDCGVACLLSIIHYHGGTERLDSLRELSGTSREGTTLLGLYQAAEAVQLKPEAYEANLDNLKHLEQPCILHVVKDNRLQHYVVCYQFDGTQFLIGDPSSGVHACFPEDVEAMWTSKALLTLEPTDDFIPSAQTRRDQWHWLWHLVREDSNILWLAAALGLIISILSLSTAVFTQHLIDEILPDENLLHLTVGLGLLALLLVAKNGLTYVRQRFLVRQTRDFNNRVINYFYGSLLQLPQSFFFNRKVGDLIARMNDTRRLQRAITHVVGDRMIDALLFLVALAFIFNYSWSLGLITLTSLPLFGTLAYAYHTPIVKGQRDVMEAHALNESNYIDTIEGTATIKAQGKEDYFTRLTISIHNLFQDQIHTLGRLGVRFNFWAATVNTAIQVAVLGWSSYLVLTGELMIGVLVAVFQMTVLLVPAAMRLALMNLELQEARVAFDRMHELTSLESESDRESVATDTGMNLALKSLEAHNLTFCFPGRLPLLEEIAFSVRRGEMIAFMGESGSGKTTLLRLLQRFHEPDKGNLLVNGSLPWTELTVETWRSCISVVPQRAKMFNGTLIDNIFLDDMSDPDATVRAVIEFCKTRGLDRYFRSLPQGYATLLGEDGANISGGQQQLVALARALYRKPQLLLLDEPTAAMDRNMERHVLDLLSSWKQKQAIIMASHRTRSVRHADRIYVLEDGRVQACGSPHELSQGNNLFALSLVDCTLPSP